MKKFTVPESYAVWGRVEGEGEGEGEGESD